MVIGKEKFALWITPEAKKEVEAHYKQDNCKSQSEYIEKAVRFYSGYLDTKHAEEYLPRVLSDVLEGKMGAFGKRMGHLLFKQAVDQDLMANLLASDSNVDLDTLTGTTYTDYGNVDYRLDGNNVDIDTESAELAKNQIKYYTMLDSVSQEFSRLKMVMQK